VSFEPGELVEVDVADIAHGGWCVARPAGKPVMFVRHALPGERVRARVTEVTSKFARADAVEIVRASPDRVQPPCANARPAGCGGCDWQHARLPAQRALKASVVREQLRRLAGIDREVTVEPLDDGDGLGWRTRVQFAVDVDGLAGLRAHRSHEVIDIGDCLIAHPGLRDLGIPRRHWEGAIAVEAAVGDSGREVVVVSADPRARHLAPNATRLRDGGTPDPGDRAPRARVAPEKPEGVQTVAAESVLSRSGWRLTPVRGRAYLTQHAAGREWRVSAGAFWQVHPAAADALTAAVLAALEPKPGDSALDLYCGAGLFAGALAAAVGPDGSVIGVESDEAAVRDARHNLRDFPWARVRRGDIDVVLKRGSLPATRLVVADPPRAGLGRRVIDHLSSPASGAVRLCYVSCDPATLARDLGLLIAGGWALEGLRAFDAFPMTHHVECVAVMARG
jgi:tRNA/tmRNA/rRNA uracil-C5-methylase (TrmA/RlmC/RlmD family)